MASHGKLAELLADLEQRAKGVQDPGDAASGDQPVTERLRRVLWDLFRHYVRADKVFATGSSAPQPRLLSSLRLLCLALDKFRGVFYCKEKTTLPFYYSRVLELFLVPKLRTDFGTLLKTLEKLVAEAVLQQGEPLRLLLLGTVHLLRDLSEILKHVSHTTIPDGGRIALECFQDAGALSGEDPTATETCPELTITLRSAESASALAAACARSLSQMCDGATAAAASLVPLWLPGALGALLRFAS
eukprot:CAMPEP_0177616244 /NCGR_PEP_ID=MMETSP0419_2-20121207/24014_1 /TAXON_ID=582737 /ORGANISM="Tetraselmis sp., Strain GSL018" /LENGTH=244 /DNA_ID=CAMNT_0019114213 /DNA_START=102 /DNA_END=833 /DNA_ORIENTATION=-